MERMTLIRGIIQMVIGGEKQWVTMSNIESRLFDPIDWNQNISLRIFFSISIYLSTRIR